MTRFKVTIRLWFLWVYFIIIIIESFFIDSGIDWFLIFFFVSKKFEPVKWRRTSLGYCNDRSDSIYMCDEMIINTTGYCISKLQKISRCRNFWFIRFILSGFIKTHIISFISCTLWFWNFDIKKGNRVTAGDLC